MLNDRSILGLCYRRLSIPKLIGLIGKTRVNLLVIGQTNCWLVTAKTPHRRHFYGAHQAIRMTLDAKGERWWDQLKAFVMKHASVGAVIRVYCLHDPKYS